MAEVVRSKEDTSRRDGSLREVVCYLQWRTFDFEFEIGALTVRVEQICCSNSFSGKFFGILPIPTHDDEKKQVEDGSRILRHE